MRKSRRAAAQTRDELLDRGEQHFSDGDYALALGCFDAALALDSDDAEAHYLRGRALYYLGQDEEVEIAYDRCLDVAPDFAPALIHKAELFVRAHGWPEEALELLEEAEALELDRDDQTEAAFVRGVALMEQGEYRLALEPLNRAVRGDSDWVDALRERGICRYYRWMFDDAIRDLERVIRSDAGDAEGHYFLAMVYERVGRQAEAARAYERASSLDPHSLHVPYRASREEFQRVAAEAIDDLPDEFRARFDNLKFAVEDLPPKELGVLPDVFAWCVSEPGLGARKLHPLLAPCRVLLFQKNLERLAADRSMLREEIGKTVLLEVGHHFGLGDRDALRLQVH